MTMLMPAGFNLVSYHVAHRSKGMGSHMILMTRPGSWATHSSGFYAPRDISFDDMMNVKLFESRHGKGVTGPRLWELGYEGLDTGRAPNPDTRTLKQAIDGGDGVEVYRWDPVSPEQEWTALLWDLEQHGKKYDMPVKIFIPLTLFRKSALKAQRKRKYDSEWWCSEYRFAQTCRRQLPALNNAVAFTVEPEILRMSPLQDFVWGWPDQFPHIEKESLTEEMKTP